MKPGVVLVTGASAGIGEATARRLAKAGHTVYGGARRLDRLELLRGDGVRPVQLDVTDDASMRAVVEQITREAGGVDVLVNNAGYGSMGAIEEVPLDEARRQLEVNLFGVARLTQLVLPGMRAKRAGRIINVSSIGGTMAFPLGGWYHASKFALEGLSDSLRMETQGFGIHVSVIQPAGTASEWSQIANQNGAAASGTGPYQDIARAMQKLNSPNNATVPADVIAKLIQRATEDRRPKTRYAPGTARIGMMIRGWLSDRLADWILLGVIRRSVK